MCVHLTVSAFVTKFSHCRGFLSPQDTQMGSIPPSPVFYSSSSLMHKQCLLIARKVENIDSLKHSLGIGVLASECSSQFEQSGTTMRYNFQNVVLPSTLIWLTSAIVGLPHSYKDDFSESHSGALGAEHMLTVVLFSISSWLAFFPGVPDPRVLVLFSLVSLASFPFSSENILWPFLYAHEVKECFF